MEEDRVNNTTLVLVILSRAVNRMRQTYVCLDALHSESSDTLSFHGKPESVMWPRLDDLIDYRACAVNSFMYIIGGRKIRVQPPPRRDEDRPTNGTGETPTQGEKQTQWEMMMRGEAVKPTKYWKRVRTVLRYDSMTGRWTQMESMTKPRSGHTATVFNRELIIVTGGTVEDHIVTNSCETYNISVNQWTLIAPLPFPRHLHACVQLNDKLYITGGASDREIANNNLWELTPVIGDSKREIWENGVLKYKPVISYNWRTVRMKQQHPLPQLARHCMVTFDHKLTVFGGICNGRTVDGQTFIPSCDSINCPVHSTLGSIEDTENQSEDHNPEFSTDDQKPVSSNSIFEHRLKSSDSPAYHSPKSSDFIDSRKLSPSHLSVGYKLSTSDSTAGLKHKSYSTADLKPKSDSTADLKPKSDSTADLKPKSYSTERSKRNSSDSILNSKLSSSHSTGGPKPSSTDSSPKRRLLATSNMMEMIDIDQVCQGVDTATPMYSSTCLPGLHQARCDAAALVIGKKLYIIGGHSTEAEADGTSIDTIDCYNFQTNTWQSTVFSLGAGGNYREVDCCLLRAHHRNLDFVSPPKTTTTSQQKHPSMPW